MRHRAVVVLVAVLGGASCAIGAPPGFSGGDNWSFPLVGALEGGPLVVPVMVHDKGPYLFLVDPDSPISQLDASLARELDLISGQTSREFVSEGDESKPMFFAEVLRIKVGTLTVRSRTFFMMPDGTFNSGGRRLRGLIGRDILADSTVFGFDRDRSMGYVATQQGFTTPAGAISFGYSTRINSETRTAGFEPVLRRLVTAKVNGHAYAMHVDLGESVSQLRRSLWSDAGLEPIAIERELVDETGTMYKVSEGASAKVELGAIVDHDLLVVPYNDRRWNYRDIDGTLGLDFFDAYSVWSNWHTNTLYLVPRGGADRTAERIGRWGTLLPPACAADACTTAALALPRPELADAPPPPPGVAPGEDEVAIRMPAQRPTLEVKRTAEVASQSFEVLIEARDADGSPRLLPRLLAILPAGETQVSQPIDTRYIGATLAVIDVSPFARTCPQGGACVYVLP